MSPGYGDLSVSTSLSNEVMDFHDCTQLLYGCWGSRLRSHACTVGVLRIEPSSQPPFYSFEKEKLIIVFISVAHPPEAPEIKLAAVP